MRRQDRQHGLVRTYRILPPPLNPRLVVNSLTSPQTTELFTNLPSKPTNYHRKTLPGQLHWVRSNDIASSSYKLLTWRVKTGPGPGPVLNLPGGLSATRIIDPEDNGGEAGVETMKAENKSEKEDAGGSHDDDKSMSFYDVGMMMMEHVIDDDEEEENGWCLV